MVDGSRAFHLSLDRQQHEAEKMVMQARKLLSEPQTV